MNHKNLKSLVKPSKHPFPANPYVLSLVLLVTVFLSCKGIASLRREYWPSSYEMYLEWWSIGSYALVVISGLTAILFEAFFFICYWKLRKIFQGSGIPATASSQTSVVVPGIELIDNPAPPFSKNVAQQGSQKTIPNWLHYLIAMPDICISKSLLWAFSASRWTILLVQFSLLNLALYMAMLGALINQLKSDAFFGVQLLKSCFSFLALGIGTMSGIAILFLFLGLILPDSKKRVAARHSMIDIDKTRDQLINRIRNQDA